MNKDEIRELRRKRLMDSKAYQTMRSLTRYMDRYYLDALIGIIPGWGDAITFLCVVPFVYFSSRVIKSIPLTLAVLNINNLGVTSFKIWCYTQFLKSTLLALCQQGTLLFCPVRTVRTLRTT